MKTRGVPTAMSRGGGGSHSLQLATTHLRGKGAHSHAHYQEVAAVSLPEAVVPLLEVVVAVAEAALAESRPWAVPGAARRLSS